MACVQRGQYRELVGAFNDWSERSERKGLVLNTSKTKEMVVDFRRSRPSLQPVSIRSNSIKVVQTYTYYYRCAPGHKAGLIS